MRTTIEIQEKHYRQLIKIASERGLRGFSLIIQEALDSFFSAKKKKPSKELLKALSMRGVLRDGEELLSEVEHIRKQWRSE